MEIKTVKIVSASSLIPESWVKNGFWEEFSDNAPFSWGGNAFSLISVADFADWAQAIIDGFPNEKPVILYESLLPLREEKVYIDLES